MPILVPTVRLLIVMTLLLLFNLLAEAIVLRLVGWLRSSIREQNSNEPVAD